jgi:hypothetical protein
MAYRPGVINNSKHYEMRASYINERNELKEVKLRVQSSKIVKSFLQIRILNGIIFRPVLNPEFNLWELQNSIE